MAYIDSDYYYSEYGGTDAGDEIDTLLERASEIIDIITGGKISSVGFENMGDLTVKKIKLAVAAEADYLDRNGGISSLDSSTPVQMTLGKFSYMNGSGTSERNSFPVSSLALCHLEAAGVISRRVAVI